MCILSRSVDTSSKRTENKNIKLSLPSHYYVDSESIMVSCLSCRATSDRTQLDDSEFKVIFRNMFLSLVSGR
jgi:hypothetical protein